MGGKFLAVFLLGFGLIWAAIRFFESASWINWNYKNNITIATGNKLEIAFLAVAIIFVVLYVMALFNNAFHKNRLSSQYGLDARNPKLGQFFTFPITHGDYAHLLGNTPKLLLFAALAVIITPNLQAFILASAVILIIQGIAIWWFGKRTIHVGASGFITGYFAFVVAYGLSLMNWQSLISLLTLIFFGSDILRMLNNRDEETSVSGHIWGFMGGVFAAIWLFKLGNPPI